MAFSVDAFRHNAVRPRHPLPCHRPKTDEGFLWTPAIAPSTPETVTFTSYQHRSNPIYAGRVVQSGQYFGPYTPAGTSAVPTQNRVYYMPIVMPYTVHLNLLGIYVAVSEAVDPVKYVRLGVYAVERGVVKDLLVSNTIQPNTVGTREVPINLHLEAGSYAFALTTGYNTAEYRVCDVEYSLLGFVGPQGTTQYTHWYSSGDGLTLSDDPTTILGTGNCPYVYARVK